MVFRRRFFHPCHPCYPWFSLCEIRGIPPCSQCVRLIPEDGIISAWRCFSQPTAFVCLRGSNGAAVQEGGGGFVRSGRGADSDAGNNLCEKSILFIWIYFIRDRGIHKFSDTFFIRLADNAFGAIFSLTRLWEKEKSGTGIGKPTETSLQKKVAGPGLHRAGQSSVQSPFITPKTVRRSNHHHHRKPLTFHPTTPPP